MTQDFEYKGYYVMYAPHPKLMGKWEVWSSNDVFVGRYLTKQSVIKALNEKP
jgi:hypothetical protein